MGKKSDLSGFDRGMTVGARRAGLSVSKTADLLGFSRTTVSRVFSEWCSKEKTSSERQLCGRKALVDERGQQRMATLVRADSKATVTQITSLYNCDSEQRSISERTARRALRRMGYDTRRPRRQLKEQRDELKQYKNKISLQLDKERLLAKQLLKNGKKDKALLLLKKKRYQDQLLDKTENQIGNLERMVEDLAFAQIASKVIEGLKVGNDCLKKMHEVMSIEEVECITDESQGATQYQQQIDEMLAGSLTQEDEEAILAELEAMTQGEVDISEVRAEPVPEVSEAEEPERERPREKPEREMLAA